MNLVTYEPRNRLGFFFDPESFLENNLAAWVANTKTATPSVNVLEKEDGFVIHAAIPGMKNGNIDLEIKDDTLTLSGRTTDSKNKETENYRIREFSQGSFRRTFPLGQSIDQDGITAKVENGMLEIYLPKKEEAIPKKVRIN